jgi:hypothetical protein
VIYKICTKAISLRLRPVLEETISQEQSAFVPGRLITDNALVAFECIHTMRRRKKARKGVCAVKLDMMKAYDRVEWPFLEAMMRKLGFPDHMINLIMKCVSSVRFSVKVNGELLPHFIPTRGIRQGHPVSPYLFLMCAEGLSSLLNNYTGGFVDRGIRVCNRAPWITHLLFADDSLIFIDASSQGAARLNTILQMYNEASGQMVNREKSSIFFSSGILEENRDLVKQGLDIMVEAFSEKYLGLPTAVGNLTNEDFEYISDRIRSKITRWDKLMSDAGKDVMIKAVLQAIPTFSMSCFQLSKGTKLFLSSPAFGGVDPLIRKLCTGYHGTTWRNRSVVVGWVSEILNYLTWLYLESKVGDYSLNLSLYVLEF